MKTKKASTFAITVVVLALSVGLTVLAQQDRDTLKVPDGQAFSEFDGYDGWQDIAGHTKVAATDYIRTAYPPT